MPSNANFNADRMSIMEMWSRELKLWSRNSVFSCFVHFAIFFATSLWNADVMKTKR